jgi:mannose-1-phosphate guanylyltransferase/phosphomannomutase
VELVDGRVTRFLEKPKREECFSNLVNTGLYILEPEVLKLVPGGEMFDFSKNLFPMMLKSRLALGGCVVDGFWVDIGHLQGYLKANMWALDKLTRVRKAAEEKIEDQPDTSISQSATLREPLYLGKNVKVRDSAVIGPYTCIGDESEISANAKIARSVVHENTRIGINSVLDTCVVAEDCKIGDHAQIERNAIIGAASELGDNSRVAAKSRVGPWSLLDAFASVQGTISPFEMEVENVSEILEKLHVGTRLTRDEARICWALSKLSVADAKAIGHFAGVAEQRTDSTLSALQERGIARSLGHKPKMFELAQ